MDCPASDAPVQDVAMRIDTVLAAVVPSSPDKLPMRGLDGRLAAIRTQSLPEEYFQMHRRCGRLEGSAAPVNFVPGFSPSVGQVR